MPTARVSQSTKRTASRVQVVGLTGGIASGKTTVVRELRKRGATVIEADRISRDIMQPESAVWKRTVAAFGESIRNRDKTIDRRKLASIVFEQRSKRKILEQITHPAILREIRKQVALLRRTEGIRLVVIDAPLLFEVGLDKEVDKTVVVWAPYEMQLRRLCRRDGLDKGEAAKRIAAQWPLEKKKKRADHVIDNSLSAGGMRQQVNKLWGLLTNISKSV